MTTLPPRDRPLDRVPPRDTSHQDFAPRTVPVNELDPRTRALLLAGRQALLMAVDAIEVFLELNPRTAELRRRLK